MATQRDADTIKRRFGKRVRTLRAEHGYSQEGFAEECDLHRTYVGAIERGEQNVSLENIAKIAASLKISLSELFDGI